MDRLDLVKEGNDVVADYQYAGDVPVQVEYLSGLKGEWAYDSVWNTTNVFYRRPDSVVPADFLYDHSPMGNSLYEHRVHDSLADAYRNDNISRLTGVKQGVNPTELQDPNKTYADYGSTSKAEPAYDFLDPAILPVVDVLGYNHV